MRRMTAPIKHMRITQPHKIHCFDSTTVEKSTHGIDIQTTHNKKICAKEKIQDFIGKTS